MRRILVVIFILILLGACAYAAVPLLRAASTPTPQASATPTALLPSQLPSPSPSPSSTVTVLPPTATLTSTPASTQPDQAFEVVYHPDGALYVGDQVSLEVISPAGMDLEDASLSIQVDPPAGPSLGPVNFSPWGIQGRDQATLVWAWDTTGQPAGTYTLAFSVQPQGYSWTEQVDLLPASAMPPAQAGAQWASTQTECCTVFYITHTASERDLPTLVDQIDEQARLAIDEMDASFTQPITITILPRLLGHGGFASGEISVSYLDRNYAANSWEMVVHHEMVHIIDGSLGGDFRPSIFVEGLAVYVSGGHYKPEPLMPRAAALLEDYLGWYIPLDTLANDFYASQHEIGYLEAASLIEYMVATYGWEAFSAFYRDIHIQEGETHSEAIDSALQAHFSISFDQLEQDFLSALAGQPNTADWVEDVRLLVTHFDTLRRYQHLLDPSAYFRTAWLLDNKTMRQRQIVADYLRHPSTPANLALEALFVTAGQQLAGEQYADAGQTLEVIDSVLDAIEQSSPEPFQVSPLAADYLSIATLLLDQGYELQRLDLRLEAGKAFATTPDGPELLELDLVRSGAQWSLGP